MNNHELLQPAIALMVLSAIMWLWMYATRIPAMQKLGITPDPQLPNGEQMAQLPARVRWKADNYNHLMEQPTLFYAVVFALVLLGEVNSTNIALAWTYVGLRTVHSLIQVLWNKIEVRFLVFTLASIALFGLIGRAALAIW